MSGRRIGYHDLRVTEYLFPEIWNQVQINLSRRIQDDEDARSVKCRLVDVSQLGWESPSGCESFEYALAVERIELVSEMIEFEQVKAKDFCMISLIFE